MYRLSILIMPTMEYRPNSRPENILASALQRATHICYEQHHIYFFTKASRLQTNTDWPHGMHPSPDSLSEAGFLFTGNRFVFLLVYLIFAFLITTYIRT